MAKKRKLTPAEQAYNKELRRINRFIKAAEKRGFIFNLKILPPRSKKITKASVQKLKKITPETLYKKASYQTDDFRIISGVEGRKLERSRAARKQASMPPQQKPTTPQAPRKGPPSIVDSVLATVEELIARFPDGNIWTDWQEKLHRKHKNMLEGMLNTQIMLYGRATIAYRFEKAAAQVVDLAEQIIYGDSKEEDFQIDIQAMARIIKGENLNSEEILDSLDLAEQYEA
jgi:hypothetical protein